MRTLRRLVAIGAALAALLGVTACDWRTPADAGRWHPRISGEGRWIVDHGGRVVMLRGVNMVQKSSPYHPAGAGFSDDDAAFLAQQGFNLVRLGVDWRALMPEPGVIDEGYIDGLAQSVDDLARHRIHVLFDFHQDGYGPLTHGNGFPEWATLTDGLPNPEVGFPAYYVQNPALQRAFDNFWANRPGPDGVGIQEHFATAAEAIARRFAREPAVIGYEAMNEPWPGTDWVSCVTGCPDLEAQLLVPFYERFSRAVTSVDRDAMVFYEPFVLFNFGQSDTSLPRIGSSGALAPHLYALTPADDAAVVDRTLAAAVRSGQPGIIGEFGATSEPGTLDRLTGELDRGLLSWAFWAYNEHVVRDLSLPPAGDNLHTEAVAAISRPYPDATDGTPLRLSFDPATRRLAYAYSTTRPDHRRARRGFSSVVVPPSIYSDGYRVEISGASVVSSPCAPVLQLRSSPRAQEVELIVTPDGSCP